MQRLRGTGAWLGVVGVLGVMLRNRPDHCTCLPPYHLSCIPVTVHLFRQVWDTGAQERFRSMVSLFYRGLDGCILTFDLTDRDTFRELDGWRQSILEQSQAADADLPFIVLGNKADVRDRQVRLLLCRCCKSGGRSR